MALIENLRGLVAVGLALLLVMLRLDAERFGTAEYDEATRDGERPRVRRRLAWYALGAGLIVLILYIHPHRNSSCSSGPATGSVRSSGASRSPRSASRRRSLFAWLRYHRIRFPDVVVLPGRAARTRSPPRSSTRRRSVARSSATCSRPASMPTVAIVIQALLYALATRLGAPERDRYLLVLALAIGLIGGWLTAVTGGIAAAFLGARRHPVRGLPVHRAHRARRCPRGREVEEIEKRRRPPDGWRVIGSRESASRDR